MNLTEAIKERHSTRNFAGQSLTDEQIKAINDSISRAGSPFKGAFSIKLVTTDQDKDFHPSTYGVIKGARSFLLLGAEDSDFGYLSAGYAMEQVVLDVTAMGLDSCWVSGTFKESTFDRQAEFPEGQKLIAVVPIGVGAEKKHLVEKVLRSVAKCGTRKDFGTMFFMNDFSTPLPSDGQFAKPLEMMRWAPSAMNAQPWRALVRGNQVDFYFAGKGRAPYLDMGIGLSHFAIGCADENVTGAFATNQLPVPAPEGWTYLLSFIQA